MKKTKLQLKTQTVRPLSQSSLDAVRGGGNTSQLICAKHSNSDGASCVENCTG